MLKLDKPNLLPITTPIRQQVVVYIPLSKTPPTVLSRPPKHTSPPLKRHSNPMLRVLRQPSLLISNEQQIVLNPMSRKLQTESNHISTQRLKRPSLILTLQLRVQNRISTLQLLRWVWAVLIRRSNGYTRVTKMPHTIYHTICIKSESAFNRYNISFDWSHSLTNRLESVILVNNVCVGYWDVFQHKGSSWLHGIHDMKPKNAV